MDFQIQGLFHSEETFVIVKTLNFLSHINRHTRSYFLKYTSFGSFFPKTGIPKPGTPLHTSPMDLKKTVPQKKRKIGSSSRTPSPLPKDPKKFITDQAERLFHESLYNGTFVPEHGFPTSNVYFTFMIENKGWTKLCEHSPPGIAHVVREFHSNLCFWEGSTVYV